MSELRADNSPMRGARAVDDGFTRTAKKEGRQVATLRRLALGSQFIVESDVYPVGEMRVDPMRPGPYVFATREEANAFIEQTTQALEYLGCEVTSRRLRRRSFRRKSHDFRRRVPTG